MHKRWSNFETHDRHGRAWKQGRSHLSLATGQRQTGDHSPEWEAVFGFEWVHFHKELRDLALKVSTTGEETLDFHYGLGLLGQHWWKLDLSHNNRPVHLPRIRFDIGLRLTGVRWCFGPDDQNWSRDASWKERLRRNDLKWWRVHRKLILTEPLDIVEEVVRLPETDVPVSISLFREVWGWEIGPYKLSRRSKRRFRMNLPGGHRVEYLIDLKAPTGLTFPGKGENSWDCGQDAIYGMSVRYPGTVEDDRDREWVAFALGEATKAVLRNRLRYGHSTADTG